jgi:hypothetical protein
MKISLAITAALISVLGLSACNQGSSGGLLTTSIDQANLCEVNEWSHDEVASQCKPGQKIVFLPRTFGNEQLPIIFAAVNCDVRYSIALTSGGVTCVYGPITPKSVEPKKKPNEAQAK